LADCAAVCGAKRQSLPLVGNAFLRFIAVRLYGNSIGETPAAFALRARVVLPVLQHRITGWLFNSHSFQIYKM